MNCTNERAGFCLQKKPCKEQQRSGMSSLVWCKKAKENNEDKKPIGAVKNGN